jgi:hypothetical protein
MSADPDDREALLHLQTPSSRCVSPILYLRGRSKSPRHIPFITSNGEEHRSSSQLAFYRSGYNDLGGQGKKLRTQSTPMLNNVLESLQNTNKNDISDLTKRENRRKNKYVRSLLQKEKDDVLSDEDGDLSLRRLDAPSQQDFVKECDDFTQSLVKVIRESRFPQIHRFGGSGSTPEPVRIKHKEEHRRFDHDAENGDESLMHVEGMSDKYTNGLPKSLISKISQLKNNPTKYNEFQRDISMFSLNRK